MPEITKPVTHTFCWVELNTSDPSAARPFYEKLFGWKMNEMPMPTGNYLMANVGDASVSGITKLPDEAKKMGAPPHWLSYVSVDDPEKTVDKAKSLGGKVLTGPKQWGPGTIALIQDPSGGVFAIWHSPQSMGSFLYGEPNALCWNELMTDNVDQAGKFYANLFNWKPETVNMTGEAYTIFKKGEQGTSGMMGKPAMAKNAPTSWLAYFAVGNVDQIAKKTSELGGKVKHQPTDIPTVGRFAILEDPQGAVFGVLQPDKKN